MNASKKKKKSNEYLNERGLDICRYVSQGILDILEGLNIDG